MSLAEAFESCRAAGAVLELDDDGVPVVTKDEGRPLARSAVQTIAAHRDRVAAILRLRELHRGMGFTEDDLLFIEAALLSGQLSVLRIVVRSPVGVTG